MQHRRRPLAELSVEMTLNRLEKFVREIEKQTLSHESLTLSKKELKEKLRGFSISPAIFVCGSIQFSLCPSVRPRHCFLLLFFFKYLGTGLMDINQFSADTLISIWCTK